jgi:hypothetical protein
MMVNRPSVGRATGGRISCQIVYPQDFKVKNVLPIGRDAGICHILPMESEFAVSRPSGGSEFAQAPRHGFDRRTMERFPFIAPIRWVSGDGQTINISASGILFETSAQLEPSSVLKLTITNPFHTPEEPKYVFCDIVVLRVSAAINDNSRFKVAGTISGMRFH